MKKNTWKKNSLTYTSQILNIITIIIFIIIIIIINVSFFKVDFYIGQPLKKSREKLRYKTVSKFINLINQLTILFLSQDRSFKGEKNNTPKFIKIHLLHSIKVAK